MTILDLTVPPFQWLVGSFDITAAVDSDVVEHPLSERGTPLVWDVSINLSYLINQAEFTESFDDWVNPQRWAAGQHPVYYYLNGLLFQTFRIDRLGYTYNEDTGESELAQIKCTDILGLLDSYTPPKDAPGLTVGVGIRWEVVVINLIQAAADEAGITITISIALTDITDTYDAPRTVSSGSYIQEAQKIAGERGYWVWCDKEVIKLELYPVAGAPIYQKSRKQIDRYARTQGLEPPLNKLVVTCAAQKVDPCGDRYPKVRVEYGAYLNGQPYLRRRVTENRTVLGNEITETIKEEAAIIFAYPPGYSFSGDPYATITTEERTKVTTVSALEKKVLKVVETISKAIGLYEDFRDSFPVPSWSLLIPNCEKRITTYNTGANNQLESIEFDEYAPAFVLYSINGGAPLVQQVEATLRFKTIDRWEKQCGESYNRITTRYVAPVSTGSSANGLIFESETTEPNTQPPEQPAFEPDFPLTTVLLSGEADFDYAGFSSFIPKVGTEQADSLIDVAGCERLARLAGDIRWQRYYSRQISHGYDPTIHSYRPFQIAHCHEGAFIRDGLKLAMGQSDQGDRNQFVIDFRGNLQGVIPAVPDTPGVAGIAVPLIQQVIIAESIVEGFGDWELRTGSNIKSPVDSFVESFGDWQFIRGPIQPVDSFVESFGDWVLTEISGPPPGWDSATSAQWEAMTTDQWNAII